MPEVYTITVEKWKIERQLWFEGRKVQPIEQQGTDTNASDDETHKPDRK